VFEFRIDRTEYGQQRRHDGIFVRRPTIPT